MQLNQERRLARLKRVHLLTFSLAPVFAVFSVLISILYPSLNVWTIVSVQTLFLTILLWPPVSKLDNFKCPKCEKPFFKRKWYWVSYRSSSCSNCSAEIGS
jgi:hypothetical protein